MREFFVWLRKTASKAWAWFAAMIDTPAEVASPDHFDPVTAGTSAIIDMALENQAGETLFLPDIVEFALSRQELDFWNSRSDTLQGEIQKAVNNRAAFISRRTGRNALVIQGGRIEVVLVESTTEQPSVSVRYSLVTMTGDDEYECTHLVGQGPSVVAPFGPRLELCIEDRVIAQLPVKRGVRVGRDPNCDLAVPADEVYVSGHAGTVQAISETRMKFLVTNRNGVYLLRDGNRDRRLKGSSLTLEVGDSIALDPANRVLLGLRETG